MGPARLALRVRDPAALRRAHGLLLAGVNSSEKLRQLVLAETDDEEEWIAIQANAAVFSPKP